MSKDLSLKSWCYMHLMGIFSLVSIPLAADAASLNAIPITLAQADYRTSSSLTNLENNIYSLSENSPRVDRKVNLQPSVDAQTIDWENVDENIDADQFASSQAIEQHFLNLLDANDTKNKKPLHIESGASIATVPAAQIPTAQVKQVEPPAPKRTSSLIGATANSLPSQTHSKLRFSVEEIAQANSKTDAVKRIGAEPSHTQTLAQAPSHFQSSVQPNKLFGIDKEPLAQVTPATSAAIQTSASTPAANNSKARRNNQQPILVDFNNIAITEYIRFVSRLTGKNFAYDENDLQFNVTIVSEEPTTLDDILTALLQILRIHDLMLIEENDNYIIHKNPSVKAISEVVIDNYGSPVQNPPDTEIVTKVIQLNTIDANNAQNVISNMMSAKGMVDVFRDTNHIVVTDLVRNVDRITEILKGIDSPQSGLTIGQYVVTNTVLDGLVELAQNVMRPMAQDQPLTLIPFPASNSIFIVTTPFLMERIMPILHRLDQRDGSTGIFDLKNVQFMNYNAWRTSLKAGEGSPTGAAGAAGSAGADGAGTGPTGLFGGFPGDDILGGRGRWQLDNQGRWMFVPQLPENMPGSASNPFIPALRNRAATLGAPNVPAQFTQQGLRNLEGTSIGDTAGGAGGLAGINTTIETAAGTASSLGTGAPLPPRPGTLTPNGIVGPGGVVTPFPTDIPPPEGYWRVDPQGNWYFQPGRAPGSLTGAITRGGEVELPLEGPKGRWVINDQGLWMFELDPGESIYSGQRARFGQLNPNLPIGYIERTKFFVYKLQFRKGDAVEEAVRRIGLSLADSETVNAGLITAINSLQWMEESNSLVMSGPPEELDKLIELIREIDRPLRQVFIEMLILDTSVVDSLNYGVNWMTQFGGPNSSGSQGFIAGASTLPTAMNTTGVVAGQNGVLTVQRPNGTQFPNTSPGFTLGVIGQHIVNKATGIEFNSLGALVTALSEDTTSNVLLNPKLLVEDGVTAEVFVGINTQFRTQSVANDLGSVITSNFEFRDIGTRMTVTPTLGPSNIITLDIQEEVSNVINNPTATNSGGGSGLLSDNSAGPTTSKSTTRTRVHVPDGFFIILSGMIQDDDRETRNQVPCLGGAPLIGGLFSYQTSQDSKRNLMIFIRPKIIDTEDEMRNITRHQQDIFRIKNKKKPRWKHEVEDAINFLNLEDYIDCHNINVYDFEDPHNYDCYTRPDGEHRPAHCNKASRGCTRTQIKKARVTH